MWVDPIVEEIRQIREAYAAKFHYDLEAIVKDIQRQQQESAHERGILSNTPLEPEIEIERSLPSK